MKQKDAVFAAFNLANENGLTGDAISTFAVEQVKNGLMDGSVEHGKGQLNEKDAKTYAGALISNWFKKDIRIAAIKYVPKTTRGPQVKDETLKSLISAVKSLKVNSPDNTDLISRVEAQIATRKAEVMATKASSKVQTLEETLEALASLGITA